MAAAGYNGMTERKSKVWMEPRDEWGRNTTGNWSETILIGYPFMQHAYVTLVTEKST